MICSKNHNNKPIEEFILVSPAPVDTAAKLSSIYINLSNKVYILNNRYKMYYYYDSLYAKFTIRCTYRYLFSMVGLSQTYLHIIIINNKTKR